MKQYFTIALIATLAMTSCIKDELVFPEPVETEKVESSERAPVKPNYIEITPLLGGDIEFSWDEIDNETVQSLSLIYEDEGESIAVTIEDFTKPYVIKDLIVGTEYFFTFQAIGVNGEESKTFTLSATPTDAVADLVIQTLSVSPQSVGDAEITWRNPTTQMVTVHVEINGDSYSSGLNNDGDASFIIPGFGNGDHIAKITVIDSVGKTSKERSFPIKVEWIVEKIAKQLTVDPVGAESAEISWVNSFDKKVTIKAVIDGKTYSSELTDEENGVFIVPELTRGTYDVQVTITDEENRTSEVRTYPVLVKMAVDAVADRVVINEFSTDGKIVVKWTNIAATPVTVHAVVDGSTYINPLGTVRNGIFTLPPSYARGTYQVKITVKDDNGNSSIEETFTVQSVEASLMINNGWSISADNEYSPGENTGLASALIDGDLNTYWHTSWQASGPDYPHWVELDLKQPALVGKFSMARRQNNGTGMRTFRLQGSLDGVNWMTVIDNQVFDHLIDGFQEFTFAPQKFRYLKMIPLTGPHNYTHLAEIQIYEYK